MCIIILKIMRFSVAMNITICRWIILSDSYFLNKAAA